MLVPLHIIPALLAGHTALSAAFSTTVPSVTLDNGTFVGALDGTTNKFLGIPFAKPPVGDLRFRLPVPSEPYGAGIHNATSFGLACPQQATISSDSISDILNYINSTNALSPAGFENLTVLLDSIPSSTVTTPFGEDCLTLNVWTPANVSADAKLPVVVWIYGGGFEDGSTSMFNGGTIVSRSIELGEPVVYVSMNYRLSAFGFIASQEVKDAGVGNIGLQDQRLALKWVQKYISAFNGDPSKVTIWGESAGAISVALQMLTHGGDTEGLFRGAFMQSGSPIPVGDITHGQKDYDALVDSTGCVHAADTLQCLREVPFETLMNAINQSPNLFTPSRSLNLVWMPRADGAFLSDDPQALVSQGSVANIPFVTGDCDDEGTLFSLTAMMNITTDDELQTYLQTVYFPDITPSQLDTLLQLYPQDPAQGSPFNTGDMNVLSPQYKRLSAIQGDLEFEAPRRFFLSETSSKQRTFAFSSTRGKDTPGIGASHGSDIANVYGPGDMTDYLINFVNDLDPNGPGLLRWPQYSTSSPQLLTFQDGPTPQTITDKTFRVDGMNFLTQLLLANPF